MPRINTLAGIKAVYTRETYTMGITGSSRWHANPAYPHSLERILNDIRARLDREPDSIYNELTSELKASPRQGYEKAFLYRKKAVSRLVAEVLARYHRRVAELIAEDRRYNMLGDVVESMLGNHRITVTTSTDPRLLYLLKQACRGNPCSEAEARTIEVLESARGTEALKGIT